MILKPNPVIDQSCINGYLKKKTRILVTHSIQHLAEADRIFSLKKVQNIFKKTGLLAREEVENYHFKDLYIKHVSVNRF